MNATLSTQVDVETTHPPQSTVTRPRRRVRLLDRLALHLGVALITWSRRERREPRPPQNYEQIQARIARERAADLHLRTTILPR